MTFRSKESKINSSSEPGESVQKKQRSQPQSVVSQDGSCLDYIAYIPTGVGGEAPILVCLHGLRRNPAEQIFRLSSLADRAGCALIAPHFSRSRFRHFQTLAPDKEGNLPEALFDASLDDFARRFRFSGERLFLFGFSGGGQFVHRYAMLGRRKIDRIAIAAPGWYTLPSPDFAYPLGTGASAKLGKRTLNPELLLSIPSLLLVGGRDTARDSSLNKDKAIDETQGRTRLERAHNWITQMQSYAASQGKDCQWSFETINGAKHNFSRMIEKHPLGDRLLAWFTSETNA